MANNWGRVVEVLTARMSFSMDRFAIEGTVPFDDDTLPNESEIKIYNLSQETINRIKRNETLIVNAGYQGDVGMILNGRISSVRTAWEGMDKITTINVLDAEDLGKRELKDVAFKSGTLGSFIIKEMAKQIGLPIAQFDLVQDYRYTEGYTASGQVTDIISKVAEDCKTSVYVSKGKLFVRDVRRSTDELFSLSSATGLIGVPEWFVNEDDKGYNLTSQLQYRISTASVIALKSRTWSGSLHVRSGSHSFSRTGDFTTAVEAVL